VARAVETYLGFARRHRQSLALIASATASRHPAVREAVAARTDRLAESLADTPETRLLVRGLIGMVEAAAVQTRDVEDADQDALAGLLTRVIWDGLSSLDGAGGSADPPR